MIDCYVAPEGIHVARFKYLRNLKVIFELFNNIHIKLRPQSCYLFYHIQIQIIFKIDGIDSQSVEFLISYTTPSIPCSLSLPHLQILSHSSCEHIFNEVHGNLQTLHFYKKKFD